MLFCILTASAFAGGNGEGGTIKIGVAGPHTGDLSPYGIPALRATELVIDDITAAGGINGNEVVTVVIDDLCDPAQATSVASRMVGEEVVAVVGHVCSGATISAMATYMSAGIPIVSPSATNPTLTQGEYTGFFRTIAPDDLQGVTQGQFLVNSLGVKAAAVIHDQQDYGKGLADGTKAELEKHGVSIPVYEGVVAGAVDYSAVVSKILNAGVDAVVFGGYHPEGSKLINQLKEKGYTGAFISGDGLKSEDFINLAGAASEGIYATGPKDYSNNAIYKKAKADHEAKYGEEPGLFFYEAYSAMLSIVEAVKAGNTTAADVHNFLLSGVSLDTAVGTIKFKKSGDSEGTGFAVYQVQSGAFRAAQ